MIAMAGSSHVPGPSRALPPTSPGLIVHNAKVMILEDGRPEAEALAVRGERIVAVGGEADIMGLRGENTRAIDAGKRRIIPDLNDSHLHLVRGARDYNLELRWGAVESLRRGLQIIAEQAKCTPERPVGTCGRRLYAQMVHRDVVVGAAGTVPLRPLAALLTHELDKC